jgi:hypothetical protein
MHTHTYTHRVYRGEWRAGLINGCGMRLKRGTQIHTRSHTHAHIHYINTHTHTHTNIECTVASGELASSTVVVCV